MTDGPVAATEPAKTEQNMLLVHSFVDDILVNGRMEKLARYVNGDHYIQHNPHIGAWPPLLCAGLSATRSPAMPLRFPRCGRLSKQVGQRSLWRVLRAAFGMDESAYLDNIVGIYIGQPVDRIAQRIRPRMIAIGWYFLFRHGQNSCRAQVAQQLLCRFLVHVESRCKPPGIPCMLVVIAPENASTSKHRMKYS